MSCDLEPQLLHEEVLPQPSLMKREGVRCCSECLYDRSAVIELSHKVAFIGQIIVGGTI